MTLEIYDTMLKKILTIIEAEPEICQQELVTKLDVQYRVRMRLILAIDNGLVIRTEKNVYNLKSYTITDKGVEVLRKLEDLDRIVAKN